MDDNVVTLPLRRIRPTVASRVKQMAPALLPERRKVGRVLHAGAVVTVAYPSGLDPSANQMETDARRFEGVVKSQYSDSVVIDVPVRQKDGSPYQVFLVGIWPPGPAYMWTCFRLESLSELWFDILAEGYGEQWLVNPDEAQVMVEPVKSTSAMQSVVRLTETPHRTLPKAMRPTPDGLLRRLGRFLLGP